MTPVRLTIDGRPVELAPGDTVLQGARRLGLDIPTLCFLEQCGPMHSCLVCVVKVTLHGRSRVAPSCGLRAEDGMVVESETAEVHELRRTALELLFSDHVGDCLSPCHRICPLDLNIPRMIRQIEAGHNEAAIATLRAALPLPATLGRLCHAPCQNGCRRTGCGGSAGIRDLERFAADADLQSPEPHLPPRHPPSGKRVAIVGAGPAGLAAAYHLLRQGHACTVFDRNAQAGGSLRTNTNESALPREVLDAEIRQLERLGAAFRLSTAIEHPQALAALQDEFDAVLLTIGDKARDSAGRLGLNATPAGLQADAATCRTSLPRVFAAGSAVKMQKQLVRAMSEGRSAAEGIDQFLAGVPIRPRPKPLSSIMGRLEAPELSLFLRNASPAPRTAPAAGLLFGFTPEEAKGEAARCLHCDCRAAGDCALQHYAELYRANPNRFPRQRRAFRQEAHPADVLFEPGKCILCGICIRLAQQAAEPLGLTFVGRGFDVRVAAPFERTFADGLRKVAAQCVAACPTGAIVFRKPDAPSARALPPQAPARGSESDNTID